MTTTAPRPERAAATSARFMGPRAVPTLVAVLLGYRLPSLWGGTLLPLLLAAVFAPACYRTLRRHRSVTVLVLLTTAAGVSGSVLAWYSADEYFVSWRSAFFTVFFLISTMATLPLLLWVRGRLGHVGLLAGYSGGALVRGLEAGWESWQVLWKYQVALPATLLLAIALLHRGTLSSADRTTRVLLVAGLLVPVSLAADARSFSGFVALAAVLHIIVRQPEESPGAERSALKSASVVTLQVATIGGSLYVIGARLAESGLLGQAVAARTISQSATGSLISTARPEWGATVKIAGVEPWGLGPGVLADGHLLAEAKLGLQERGVRTGGEYTNEYLFGAGGVKLHAISADLWLNFGLIGAVLAAILVGLLMRGLTTSIMSSHPLRFCSVLLVIIALWGMFFGPLFSNLPDVVLALVLTLGLRTSATAPSDRDRQDHTT